MGDTQRSQTISTELQGIAEQTDRKAGSAGSKVMRQTGRACLVTEGVKTFSTEEPDEGNLHVRICGEGVR